MTKKGCTPVNIDNKGEAAFCCRQGIRYTCRRHQSNQWHDVCASTVHYSSRTRYIFAITVSEQRNAQRPMVQALSSPKSQTSWYPVRTGNTSSAHRERALYARRVSQHYEHTRWFRRGGHARLGSAHARNYRGCMICIIGKKSTRRHCQGVH